MSESKGLSIFDLKCEVCKEAGRAQPSEIVYGAASGGRHPNNVVLCGTCGSIIYKLSEEEENEIQVGPFGDNEELRQYMAGNTVIIELLKKEDEEE